MDVCVNSVMEAEHESGWPDLPSNVMGLVLSRLPSFADRVRLGAVCRGISSTIKLLPPYSQVPWIILQDGTVFDLSSNVPVHQLRLPGGAFCYSAGENMLFVLHNNGRCSLMNALSGDTIHLPELAAVLRKYKMLQDDVKKVVMSKSSPDHGPIIAVRVGLRVILSTCRPAGETNSCINFLLLAVVDDMAFFQGRFYALCGHRLITFELNNGCLDKPMPPGTTVLQGFNNELNNMDWMTRYLVESNGKLLVTLLWTKYTYGGLYGMAITRERFCEVWEADMSDRRWKKVNTGLDGRALFVSFPCSMSAPASVDGLHGAREDCIYFLRRGELGSCVYNMRTETFSPLPHELMPLLHELTPPLKVQWGPFRSKNKQRFPTWFSPNSATPGSYGKVRHSGGRKPVGAKSRRTCTAFLSFPPILFACHDWIRKWDPQLDSACDPPSDPKVD